jgi:hypothetical protein
MALSFVSARLSLGLCIALVVFFALPSSAYLRLAPEQQ